MPSSAAARLPEERICKRCHAVIAEDQDHETTPDGLLCRPCHEVSRPEQARDVLEQGREINYFAAAVGALAGGAVGALAWWGITVVSNVVFGVVAILIGIAVGKGTVLLAGNGRSRGLQILSLGVAGASFFYATYLVNRTFIQQALAQEGKEAVLPFLPDPALFLGVVSINLSGLDLLFLGIVLWEAWQLGAPLKLR